MTPLAAPGSTMQRLVTGLRADGSADASGAMATALSPDERTLLVETSGYNYQYYQPNGREIQFPLRDPLDRCDIAQDEQLDAMGLRVPRRLRRTESGSTNFDSERVRRPGVGTGRLAFLRLRRR